MSRIGLISALRQGWSDLKEDLQIVSRRVGHKGKLTHPAVWTDMSGVALTLMRTSIALRSSVGSSFGTRAALKWVFRIDLWTDDVGPGLTLPHPFNIVVGNGVSIGKGCTIMHNTTFQHAQTTRIEDGAVLGVGAVILANKTIGQGAFCGANSVVTRDVPKFTVVVGSPAKAIRKVSPSETVEEER